VATKSHGKQATSTCMLKLLRGNQEASHTMLTLICNQVHAGNASMQQLEQIKTQQQVL
jgi:hypothetical protein